jgi:hypothetical protein
MDYQLLWRKRLPGLIVLRKLVDIQKAEALNSMKSRILIEKS